MVAPLMTGCRNSAGQVHWVAPPYALHAWIPSSNTYIFEGNLVVDYWRANNGLAEGDTQRSFQCYVLHLGEKAYVPL